MNDYIVIDGKKVLDLSDEQVAQLKRSLGPKQRLGNVKIGETVCIAGIPFVVLEHSKETTAVITRNLIDETVPFGSSNYFVYSDSQGKIRVFLRKIRECIGDDNIVMHTVDMTSEDGLTDYKKMKMKCSLLTSALYRRYVHILDKYKVDSWWWLCTPHSTKTHRNNMHVKAVSPNGFISNVVCTEKDSCGLRPFLILMSDTFVD